MLSPNASRIEIMDGARHFLKTEHGVTDEQINRALDGLANIREGLRESDAVTEFGHAFLKIFEEYAADMVADIIRGQRPNYKGDPA